MNESDQQRLTSARMTGDTDSLVRLADRLLLEGDPHAAAVALDCAYGLNPSRPDVSESRSAVLDRLSVNENGIQFRYVPGGAFRMGSDVGDPDELPVHEVRLGHYWLSERRSAGRRFAASSGGKLRRGERRLNPPVRGRQRELTTSDLRSSTTARFASNIAKIEPSGRRIGTRISRPPKGPAPMLKSGGTSLVR